MILTPSVQADILIFCILSLIALHSFKLKRQCRWMLLDPLNTFWAGVLIVYILQPISYATTFIGWHPDGVFEETLFWILFGLIFVIIGYEYPIGRIREKLVPRCPVTFIPERLAIGGYLFIVLSFIGYLYQFNSAGGVIKWLAVGRGGTDWENVSGYLAALADLLPIGVLVLLFHAEMHNVTKVKRIIIWLVGGLMLLWLIYLGSRSRTIMFVLVLLSAFFLPKRKNPPVLFVLTTFIALAVLVNFQALYRESFTNLSMNLDTIDIEEAYLRSAPVFLGGDIKIQNKEVSGSAEFNCVMSVVELVPERVPYNYGYGHLEIFTRIIPRVFWPDKVYPAMESVQGVLREGGLSSSTIRSTNLLMGPAFTFAGHWYYVGGAFGLVFGGLLTGLLLRLIRHIYERAFPSEGDIILYTILVTIGFGEAAGTPLLFLTSLPILLVPLVPFFYWARKPLDEKISHLNELTYY